jgi:hypothetical protein
MNVDKTIKRTLFAAVALLGAGVTVALLGAGAIDTPQAAPMAVPITGTITIKGGAHLNTKKNAARKSDTFSSGRFSNLKRRSVIVMGGSVFADVGREAGGPA